VADVDTPPGASGLPLPSSPLIEEESSERGGDSVASAQQDDRRAGDPDAPVTTVNLHASPAAVSRWAWGILGLLVAMHLLDSTDRWVLAIVLPQLSEGLELSEIQAGWLSTVLLLAFAISSPPIGYLADRMRRPRLLAVGFALWSLATVATGMAQSYLTLVAARAVVGVGAATFGVVALTILMDLFPRAIRGRVLASFYLAMPAGAALGLCLGAAGAMVIGWPPAFLAVGAPGLVLALVALALPEPARGTSEGVDIQRLRVHEQVGPSREDYIDLIVNSSYTYSVFGMAFSSFAVAGLVYWSPTFLASTTSLTREQTDSTLGLTLLGAAILGIGAGGWLADRFISVRPRAMFLIPGLAMLAAIPFVLAMIYGRGLPLILGGTFVAVLLMFLNIGPCYSIIANVVMPNMRGVACGVALGAVHLLGDLWSPTLMGWVVDTFGQADSMATGFGQALAAVGAVPVVQPGRDPENLTAGMLVVVPALLISGIVLLSGSRHLPREMALMLAKLKAAPGRRSPMRRP
jgi:MFS transporter, Spinster family, sphingosine-1-phosphate transporter